MTEAAARENMLKEVLLKLSQNFTEIPENTSIGVSFLIKLHAGGENS